MIAFRTLINIDADLPNIIKEIGNYFNITLNEELINTILRDAEENQVSEKKYTIFEGHKKISGAKLTMLGTVDEYEPETIWIEIKDIEEKEVDEEEPESFVFFNVRKPRKTKEKQGNEYNQEA